MDRAVKKRRIAASGSAILPMQALEEAKRRGDHIFCCYALGRRIKSTLMTQPLGQTSAHLPQ